MTDSCATCWFSRTAIVTSTNPGGGGVTSGSVRCCHALPPQNGNPSDPNFADGWRKVDDTEWCGYFSPDGVTASVALGRQGATGPAGATGAAGSGTQIYITPATSYPPANSVGNDGDVSLVVDGRLTLISIWRKQSGAWASIATHFAS